MTRSRRTFRRAFTLFLLVIVCVTSVGLGALRAEATVEYKYNSESLARTSLAEIENVLTSTSYQEYKSFYGGTGMATDAIRIDVVGDLVFDDSESLKEFSDPKILENLKNAGFRDSVKTSATVNVAASGDDLSRFADGFTLPEGAEAVLICGDDGRVSFRVKVEKDACYNINVSYFTGNVSVYGYKKQDGEVVYDGMPVVDYDSEPVAVGKDAAMERYILVDGKVPYSEARSVELNRVWCDRYEFEDENGETKVLYSNTEEFRAYVEAHRDDYEAFRPYAKDGNGNELKPEKVLVGEWADTYLHDSTGYFNEPLWIYLSAGEHIISLQTVRETAAISAITLETAPVAVSYDEYYKANGGDGAVYKGDYSLIAQAEYAATTSERTIYQLNNRSSVYSQPQDSALIRLNEIGGEKWEYVGQWVEWNVEVPEAGFYDIIPRAMQGYYSGVYVSRKIYINGEIPFAEAGNLRFDYTSNWVTDSLHDGNREYLFYLKEGTNTVRLEVVLGDMAEILSEVNVALTNVNSYYRKILMITGSDPDEYRDYTFERLIPDVLKGLKTEAERLYAISKKLAEMTGGMGSHSATLDRVANVCERMGKYPSTIAGYMDTLKSYSSSLGTWLADTQNQPLDIDYLCIQASEADAPKAEPGFFAKLWGGIQKFFASFFSDYDSLGSTDDGETIENAGDYTVEVWTVTSRDQAQIIRNLVDNSFTPIYGLPVVVKLVAGGTLLPATLAGTGPDVYMGASGGDAINYALRSAVLSLNTTTGNQNIGFNFNDLSTWADDPVYKDLIANNKIPTFDEVTKWFAPSALTPLTLYGETYGIPQTMAFPMMFYRKDIFVELGVAVPDTWEDFYNIIYSLQAEELDIGFPTGISGSLLLMYQQNESYYDEGNYDYYLNLFRTYYEEAGYDKGYESVDDFLTNGVKYTYEDADGNLIPKTDGITINLDSDVSLAMFKKVCELFTMYDFPVTYSFANRFRSGEMPLAVTSYEEYNSLIVFAPEINGLWEFTPLPGTLYEDPETGETHVKNTTVGAVTTMLLMRSVNEKNALGAWTYMQWWMSADVQSSFGNEMIALLGPSAKQATANMEALEGMSWSKDELDNLTAQFKAVECTPEYPGSYIVGRYTNFAFLNVYNDDDNPVEAMQSYITDINNELTRKRTEFGLPTEETIKEMEEYLRKRDYDLATFKKKGGE